MVSLQTTDEAAKQEFALSFATTESYLSQYPAQLSNAEFVERLRTRTGVADLNWAALIDELNKGTKTRPQVLREVADAPALKAKTFTENWVVMSYFGYLRRDGSAEEYDAWRAVLEREPQKWRQMTEGFVNSIEYRNRFGKP